MANSPINSPRVAEAYSSFPEDIRTLLLKTREMILTIGNHIDSIGSVEETIKWGEPSYSTISGSSVRLGWKKKEPEKYRIFFHCQTKLISTFRKRYPQTFAYEGNRAIVLNKDDQIPEDELKHCIELALTYHQIKNKPMLGLKEEIHN